MTEDKTTVLTLSYMGAAFSGFARQPGLRTVQGEVEKALATVLRREVETVGAGRTDAGVHATGQVVSAGWRAGDPGGDELRRALNGLTDRDLVVRDVRHARPGFSARFDALAREYRYRLVSGSVPPVFLGDTAWWVKSDLDIDAMEEAGLMLVGEHDFRSFCVTQSAEGRPTTREVRFLGFSRETEMGEECVHLRVTGNAFLHSMVRVIAGTLVEVGSGRRPASWAREVLEARDRAAAGPTAPAHGLTFWQVSYPEDVWID